MWALPGPSPDSMGGMEMSMPSFASASLTGPLWAGTDSSYSALRAAAPLPLLQEPPRSVLTAGWFSARRSSTR